MSQTKQQTAVAAQDLSKAFRIGAGKVLAVDAITLDVEAGTSLAITGPSGCGKSTLLSLIGALEPPTSGRVQVAGEVVSQMSERRRAALRRRRIGFVFQSDNLQPFLTATENISLALSLAGIDDGYERTPELLERLGLANLAGRYPDALSGGERQRVAVARAIVHRPELILADEPTGSLDSANSQTVIDLLVDAQRQTGATLILITHDPDVADLMDRRVHLRDGRICDDGLLAGARGT